MVHHQWRSNGGPVPILQEFEAAYLGRKNTSKYAFLDANARLGKECVSRFVFLQGICRNEDCSDFANL